MLHINSRTSFEFRLSGCDTNERQSLTENIWIDFTWMKETGKLSSQSLRSPKARESFSRSLSRSLNFVLRFSIQTSFYHSFTTLNGQIWWSERNVGAGWKIPSDLNTFLLTAVIKHFFSRLIKHFQSTSYRLRARMRCKRTKKGMKIFRLIFFHQRGKQVIKEQNLFPPFVRERARKIKHRINWIRQICIAQSCLFIL